MIAWFDAAYPWMFFVVLQVNLVWWAYHAGHTFAMDREYRKGLQDGEKRWRKSYFAMRKAYIDSQRQYGRFMLHVFKAHPNAKLIQKVVDELDAAAFETAKDVAELEADE